MKNKILILLLWTFSLFGADGHIVYLTWEEKPDTSIIIHWISTANDEKSEVSYVQNGKDCWAQAKGSFLPLPYGHKEHIVHAVKLESLYPNTKYHFRLGNKTPVYSFQTMPSELKEPIRFVVGGDLYQGSIEPIVETNKIAAQQFPKFAILGGDIAYSAEKDIKIPEDVQKWLKVLQVWEETMLTPDGLMVPILPTTSNEDTRGRYEQAKECAACFYTFFSFPGKPGYNVLDFGNYMSLWLLDSGHTNPIEGKQSFWLQQTLKSREKVPYKFAAYHVPAYPSVRSQHLKYSVLIRKQWVPSFDQFNLTAAFEHHDHAYKRTKPIRNQKVDNKGTIYFGDGGWGVLKPRIPVVATDRWYLEKTAPRRHFHLITLSPGKWEQSAIDFQGNVFDSYNQGENHPVKYF